MVEEFVDKYCIIGGGAYGIGIGKCLKQANITFDIIEKEDNYGGNWYEGKPCSKMYGSAHLISSKTNTQFSDFPMPEDYPDYPKHNQMLSYLRSVAKHFNLYENTRFNSEVKHIEPIGNYWKVRFSDQKEYLYGGVIVANGLLREPKYPNYPGKFNGTIIHVCAYKHHDIFKGKRVLIVGGGNSGCDVAVDAVHSAESVFHSLRRGYYFMPKFINGKPTQDWQMEVASQFNSTEDYWDYVKKVFKFAGFDGTDYGLVKPEHEINQCHPIMNSQVLYYIGHGDIKPKPDIKELRSESVIFDDGTEEKIDIIVYATGYKTSFPFIDQSYLSWSNALTDLYCYGFHKKYDNLVFAGYISAPSGLGNIINTYGKLLAAYFLALRKNTKSIQIFREIKLGSNPSLGNDVFLKSERHAYEVDLWKLIKFYNSLRAKFERDC